MSLFTVDRDKCARDGMCVSECPVRIISIREDGAFPQLVRGGEEFCVHCGHCVAVCPHGALEMNDMSPDECLPVRKDLIPGSEQVDHFLRSRRSIRSYRDKPVDRETLSRLIGAANYAPSGHNSRPVHWLVVENAEGVRALAALVVDWMRSAIDAGHAIAGLFHFDRVVAAWEKGEDRILRRAPHLIIAHGNEDLPPSQTSCIIALTYLELAAYSHGLGACWAGYFNAAANMYQPLQDALALPPCHRTFGAMMVGHAKYKFRRIPVRSDPRINWR